MRGRRNSGLNSWGMMESLLDFEVEVWVLYFICSGLSLVLFSSHFAAISRTCLSLNLTVLRNQKAFLTFSLFSISTDFGDTTLARGG